jgi:putative oxidoreductase
MKWAVLIVRVIVGLGFLLFGADFFLHFIPKEGMPTPPPLALGFVTALMATKYMTIVKVLELVGGFFVLTGRLAPLGLTLLIPVTVNIALWDAFLVEYKNGPPIGTVMLALELFLLYAYRKYFANVFSTKAVPSV